MCCIRDHNNPYATSDANTSSTNKPLQYDDTSQIDNSLVCIFNNSL